MILEKIQMKNIIDVLISIFNILNYPNLLQMKLISKTQKTY